jgi:hypothetical protein
MLRNASRLELRTYSYDQQDEQSRWKSMFEIDDSVAIQELAKSVELTTDPWELLYYFTLHGDYQVVAYDDSGNRIGYFDVINRGEAVTWRLQPEGKPSPVSQRLATDQFTSVAFRQALNKLILKTLVEKRETIALHHYTYMLREVSLPEAMPLLAAEIPTADPLQRKAIVYHLTAYEGDRTTIAPLLQLARDPDDEVRKTALYALRPFIHEPRVHVFLQSFNLQAEPSADARAIVQGHRGEIVSIF